MGYYFPIILLLFTVFTAICYFFFLFVNKDQCNILQNYIPFKILKYARDFFWVFLIVLVIRSFIASLYSVPTGSLEPTVMPGDILLTTKYNYGLYVPVWNYKFIPVGKPKRSDIILFHDPVHPKSTLIKRVIGLPGDRISYINKVLIINGKKASQTFVGEDNDIVLGHKIAAQKIEENLLGVKHQIFIDATITAHNFYNLLVPQGHYFVMGDNRDYSDDSRYWGFVPAHAVFAKAQFVLINFKNIKRAGHQV